MDTTISHEAIAKHLRHIDASSLQGRMLPLHSVYESGEWKFWVSDNEGGLLPIKAKPFEACYFAQEKCSPEDARLRPIEFLHQRAGWRDTADLANSLLSDIRNLACSLAKLRFLHEHRDSIEGVSRMAATEVEYLFMVCRSAFDLLQKIVVRIWKRIELLDQTVQKRNLPDSWRKMVMQDRARLAIEEIMAKHVLPRQIAQAYEGSGKFFEWLRDFRDLASHHGGDLDHVFTTEHGFAVSIKSRPFSTMPIWSVTNVLPNNLGSLQTATRYVVLETLKGLSSIIYAFESVIRFPPPVAPEHVVLVRGPHIGELVDLERSIAADPWYKPRLFVWEY